MPSNRYEGGEGSLQQVVALGVSTVSTQTKIVGLLPKNCVVKGVRYHGQAAVTAAGGLTAEAFLRTSAGATGATLQASATDIKFSTAALALAGTAAVLTTTSGNQYANENQVVEVTVTTSNCAAGPGDLLIEVEYEPR